MNTVDASEPRIDVLARRTAGLRLRGKDLEALSRWTAERVSVLALAGVEDYAALLAEDSPEGQREREMLTVQFTTGETYFFRDQGQFELLAKKILPDLIERRSAERRLRIWSAGCSSGEEAYSLAMLVDELSPQLAGWNVLILGTDIDSKAIARARKGSYGQWSFRALDAARKQRYFRERGDEWKVDPRLRGMVTFRRGDLLREGFPDAGSELHDMDLIVCRNVFIYLEPEAVARIAAKFADTLTEGGYLMTAHSELFGHSTGCLRTRVFPESVVFQKSAQPAPAAVFAPAPWQTTIPIQMTPIPTAAGLRYALPDSDVQKKPAIEQRVVPAAPPPQPSAEDLEALMSLAWRDANRGARDAAQKTCRKATAIAAFDPRPYYLLAQLAQERGEVEETKALLRKVTYLDPSFVAAYLELGALYECEGDAEHARTMRQAARSELKKLPAQATLAIYGDSTAAEILRYVERLLGEPAAQAGREAPAKNERPAAAPLRSNGGMHG